MSAATAQPPVVPPRPVRSQDKDQMPKIPPRPINRRIERSRSPNRDRFAPSPLNFAASTSLKELRFDAGKASNGAADPIDRSGSVDMPSVGEEGKEYAMVAEELSASRSTSTSPEQTRSIGDDVKLHAPKPSLPATSAKQRVAVVTRTDSDRAASFGIGRPSSEDPAPSNRSLKKKASTISQVSSTAESSHIDDEQGIPEIGKQVPMYPNAGDVQAPSPAPGLGAAGADSSKGRHHARKTSARGYADLLPPGSYGLHGHGVKSQDKLGRAYYEKHPHLIQKEHTPHHNDRPDFARSHDELNKIVHETASRESGKDVGTPSEQVGWQAIEESASRIASPRPTSAAGPRSPTKRGGSNPEIAVSDVDTADDASVIHVDDPGSRRSVMFSDDEVSGSEQPDERRYSHPILAEDELAKHPLSYDMGPAVNPPAERAGSAFEMEPSSRPSSRPGSIYRDSSLELRSTPLEDVEEYEPLFPDDDKTAKKEASPVQKTDSKKQRFPGRDIWEDAPDSVHFTAEVSTPDQPQDDDGNQSSPPVAAVPPRHTETPAHAWARHHEQLAETESKESPDAFLRRGSSQKPTWVQGQSHLAKEKESSKESGGDKAKGLSTRPVTQRFPSRDVWEDTPDSHMLETTVSQEQDEIEASTPVEYNKPPEIPQRPAKSSADASSPVEKPVIPERPKPKRPTPGDESGVAGGAAPTVAKPIVPDRPKPQIPSRPVKHLAATASASAATKDAAAPEAASASASSPAPAAPKAKPAVPARPVGGKIAALQAGFMSDLNKRLQLGPQAPKKPEEPLAAAEDSAAAPASEEKEKAPLVDARKGRARGPQRRAPAKSQSPSPAAALAGASASAAAVAFTYSATVTLFSIDPEDDVLKAAAAGPDSSKSEEKEEASVPVVTESEEKKPAEEEEARTEEKSEPVVEKKEEEVEEEEGKAAADVPEPTEDKTTSATKTETLATNMAGETVVEAEVEESKKDAAVEPVKVDEVAKD